jgi:two-component sensor histidine kinase
LDEPLAECSKYLGWCCPWSLDGRGASPAEKDAQRDDKADSPTSQQEPVIQKGFNRGAKDDETLNSHDMATFEQAFSARLLAHSSTHNLLTESAWSGVELRELLTKELEPFRGGPHLLLSGPAVTLTSKVAIALGMAIHEMATNATKHGAFQAGGGSVRISWSVSDGNLTLKWQERCGHPIVPPSRQGFGSRLIQQTIVRELQGTVDMIYNNNGLQATFTIHLSVDDNIKDQAEAGVDMEPA